MTFLRRRRKDRPVQLSTKPAFPVDEKLVERQIAEAKKLGPNSIKRVILEEDTFVTTPFVSELPIG